MKYSKVYIKAIFAFLIIGCISCKTSQNLVNTDVLEDSLLWKIQIEGNEQPSYLYGTIHLIPAEDYFLPQGTLSAIDNSKEMVFEIDMNEMNDMAALMGLMDKIFMNDNKTLKDLITQEDYDVVNAHFKKIGMPLGFLERFKPMFLSVFAYGDMDPNGLKTGDVKTYEMELFEISKNKGMSVDGLETIDFQIGLFDAIPYEDQAKMLVETIKNSGGDTDEFKKMVEMYKAQDINAMVTMLSEEGEKVENFEDELLVKRNKSWIPIMIEKANNQPTFFAVGAGHLGGEIGVIKLLRKQGVKVTAVK
jgi:hypothetical protein